MILIGGPCGVESESQMQEVARYVSDAGVKLLRGGAFKPRTSPTSFQGLGEEGLKIMRGAADAHGLKVVTEVLDTRDVGLVGEYADIFQIGARNMRNYELLKEVGAHPLPVLLKRGLAATVREWLMASEYVGGRVILCERGHRTYMEHVRFMLDVAAIQEAKREGYTVIADPSHAAGKRELVEPLAMAALAAGADGLIIETHPAPLTALSDQAQQLYPEQFGRLVRRLRSKYG